MSPSSGDGARKTPVTTLVSGGSCARRGGRVQCSPHTIRPGVIIRAEEFFQTDAGKAISARAICARPVGRESGGGESWEARRRESGDQGLAERPTAHRYS